MAYTPHDYASMLGDKGRMTAYTAALRRAITPESVVLDLGTGMGYFAVLACNLGAKRVYAIEPNPAISVGKQLAKDNNVADRITWFEDHSGNVTLPEKVDVIVSDIRGVLPYNEYNVPAIKDARARFLKPGGTLLPQQDQIWVAIASDDNAYCHTTTPWKPLEFPEINLDSYEKILTNTYVSREAKTTNLLSSKALWNEIDYQSVTTLNHRKTLEFTIARTGPGHGFYAWFDAQVDPEANYSFAPDNPITVYGSAFFPWVDVIELRESDTVSIDLAAYLGANGFDWTWNTHHSPRNPEQSATSLKQSTFFDTGAISKEFVKKKSPHFTPALTKNGAITLRALSLMDKSRSNAQIAQILESEFPDSKKTSDSWKKCISDLSVEFSV